jgi:hypothetical protein
VKNYVKKTHPGLNTGTTLTWAGLTGSASKAFCHSLNLNSDIISTTYYGIDSVFIVKQPSAIPNDFAALVTEYPTKPIYYQECGYPTSDTCKSNDSLQSVFVYYVFSTWDVYKTQIPFIAFLSLTDMSYAQVDTLANYYNFHNATWMEYLRTLGLRTYPGNGTSKAGYNMLAYQAYIRGACSVTGIEQPVTSEVISVYPNPAQQSVNIDMGGEGTQYTMRLYDLPGNCLLTKTITGNKVVLNISTFGKGLYFIEVENLQTRRIERKKLIIQ